MFLRGSIQSISGEDRRRSFLNCGDSFGDTFGFYMGWIYRVIFGLLAVSTGWATEPPPGFHTPSRDSVFVLERFEYPDQFGQFPKHWEGRTGWRQTRTVDSEDLYYRIQKEERKDGEENHFLQAETTGRATNAGREAKVNLRLYNLFRWRWRVHQLPEGGNEEVEDKNDSGAAVRLVFKGWPVPKTLKYVWSATLPAGTETVSPASDKTKVIVLESGTDRLGQWVWEEVNAYEDYKRLFGGEPRLAFAVITDSDNTKSPVRADYDDVVFLIAPEDTSKSVQKLLQESEHNQP